MIDAMLGEIISLYLKTKHTNLLYQIEIEFVAANEAHRARLFFVCFFILTTTYAAVVASSFTAGVKKNEKNKMTQRQKKYKKRKVVRPQLISSCACLFAQIHLIATDQLLPHL